MTRKLRVKDTEMMGADEVYKLVRCTNNPKVFLSANQWGKRPQKDVCFSYRVDRVTDDTDFPNDYGLAAYDKYEWAWGFMNIDKERASHIRETMFSFNNGKPVAILKCYPVGRRSETTKAVSVYKNSAYPHAIFHPSLYVDSVEKIFTEVPD